VRDLPVALALPPRLRDEVAAFVETEGGWQVVGLDGPPRPALVIADAPLPGRASVVLVEGGCDPARLRAALHAGAIDVVTWPAERGRLLAAPGRLAGSTTRGGPPVLAVAGTRGGVGTSTVALALGGLVAWAGRPTLVVGDDDLLELCGLGPWRGPGAPDIAALGAQDAPAEVAALARTVPGVPRLAVLGGGTAGLAVTGWPGAFVVIDAGTRLDPPPQLVCARAGAGLQRARAVDAPVVLVGEGPLSAAAARRALGRRPAAHLPASARVGRAGVAGRVPAALPGTWLAAVRGLARRLVPAGGAELSTGHADDLATTGGAPPTVGSDRGPEGGERR
jgi:hypothetical protein